MWLDVYHGFKTPVIEHVVCSYTKPIFRIFKIIFFYYREQTNLGFPGARGAGLASVPHPDLGQMIPEEVQTYESGLT